MFKENSQNEVFIQTRKLKKFKKEIQNDMENKGVPSKKFKILGCVEVSTMVKCKMRKRGDFQEIGSLCDGKISL
jgi:hypothetical protein